MDAASTMAAPLQDPDIMPAPTRNEGHALTFNPDVLAQIEPDISPAANVTAEQKEVLKAQKAAAAAAKAARAVERDQLVDDAAVMSGSCTCTVKGADLLSRGC